jgi:hypothetical protein
MSIFPGEVFITLLSDVPAASGSMLKVLPETAQILHSQPGRSMLDAWRLKLLDYDNVIKASHPFSDLKALLVAARRVAAARPDLRLVITVPVNALEEDRERVRQIADRFHPGSNSHAKVVSGKSH